MRINDSEAVRIVIDINVKIKRESSRIKEEINRL